MCFCCEGFLGIRLKRKFVVVESWEMPVDTIQPNLPIKGL
jgi:hypothetical protein